MHLSVIVPAYNEEKNLKKNIKEFVYYLNKQKFSYELIIVDDGSTDNTLNICNDLAKESKTIKIIKLTTNQGKGAATRKGLLESRGKYALFLDADGATAIDHAELIWPYFEQGYDLVIASRNPKDAVSSRIVVPQSNWKQNLGKLGNHLIRFITGIHIHDTQCGFKAFSRQAIESILPKTTINRWSLDVEILFLAKKYKYDIAIIPVSWRNSDESRVKILDYPATFIDVLKVRLYSLCGKYSRSKK